MAMNKREAERLADAERAARTNRALRWSDYETAPDLPIPEEGHTQGWDYNAWTYTVTPAWSESTAHGNGEHSAVRYGPQNGRALYSTRRRALCALRRAMEENFATRLAEIDEAILQEEA